MAEYRKTAHTLPPGAKTLPGRYYTSHEIFCRELEKIFFANWLCVAREGELPRSGDLLTLEVGRESVVIVRQGDGGLRAFYNVCRHRGTRICDPGPGHARHLRCPYHGWKYDLAGRLVTAPLMAEVDGFRKADHGLAEVAVGTWAGFVFLNFQASPPSLTGVYAPLEQRTAGWNMTALASAHRRSYDIDANWKIVMENYSECYHCPLVHPAFSRKVPYRSGRNDLYEGPFLGGYMELRNGVESLTRSGHRCAPPVGDIGGEDLGRVYFYAAFPNLTLALHPDYVMSFILFPRAADHTRVVVDWLFDPGVVEEGRCDPSEALDFWDATNREDWEVCRRVQSGLSSRSYHPAPSSTTESLPVAFCRQVLVALGDVVEP